ncbi:PilZ domain-containing protein [Alteromonas sp. KUL49]|uniref:PilZ domain-containing protein n=1 Tax=Alteromonas sp. KUL49 TaxID=2480798 RepID=UPI00102F1E26|nr:PilZ domain-containing protein [Alteromonas sp. KUL49]TAP40748.1 PilZ domain-containing protein [Alteromonas sp. KUL49]GEA10916.1 hypothetical protein KUL49_12910 [Alteromonas sp. KUL49]
MAAGEEENIIKQYQPLIRALIPYEQQNRLLEGINKFSKRLPSQVRKVVKDEVVRLTSLTDAPADNSAFAQFPVMKFKHRGVQMRLDKVGAEILKNETSLYQDRYTVGVFESIMNSDFYQTQIKKDQFKKIVDAFKVESQSFTDIDFGEDIAIKPNFTVSSSEFDKGRHCPVTALAYDSMSVETKRPPASSIGDKVSFCLPEALGSSYENTEIEFVLEGIKFNKAMGKYESYFALAESTPDQVKVLLQNYIKTSAYKQPLQRDLEIERTLQDLERDRILENCPWLPVFASLKSKERRPLIALFTRTSVEQNKTKALLDSLSGKQFFSSLTSELGTYGEAYVFQGNVKTKSGEVSVTVTHRQLLEAGQLSAIVYLLARTGDFVCTQCRLDSITPEDKDKAFAIHDVSADDNENLNEISHVIYCREVTSHIENLTLLEKCDFKPLSKNFRTSSDKHHIDFVMEEALDRRAETRYVMDKAASVKLGLLSTVDVRVKDLSASGMKIFVPTACDMQDEIRVSIPDFKIKSERYKVIDYNTESGVARLSLVNGGKKSKTASQVDAMVEVNSAYFKLRDVARIQRATHRFLWELAVRHLPSLSVLCVINRHILDRLKTVYQSDASDDLYPFSRTQNITPLHGFFADKAETKPKSKMLESMFSGEIDSSLVVHCIRNSDKRLVFIKEQDFMASKLRGQIQNQLEDNKVQVSATDVVAVRCNGATTPLTKKRFAQLSKVDKTMYNKLYAMQEGYTHCIFVTNISVLHHDLVLAKLIQKPTNPSDKKKSVA